MAIYNYNKETILFLIKTITLEILPISNLNVAHNHSGILTIVEIDTTTKSWITNGNFYSDWDAKISLVNADGSAADSLENNGWYFNIAGTCSDPDNSRNRNQQYFKAKYIDSFETETSAEVFAISPKGLVESYRRFIRLSKEKGYRVAKLEIEKQDLAESNKLLNIKINELNAEIAKLKDRISYMG